MLNRHPFPGPGLGVRILGEISKEKVLILQNADAIFIEELIKADLYDQVSQAFCVFLPIKSVGVVGDERRYADVIAIRAVETVDFMTADWAKLPHDFLAQCFKSGLLMNWKILVGLFMTFQVSHQQLLSGSNDAYAKNQHLFSSRFRDG